MHYYYPFEELRNNPKFIPASEILGSVLRQEIPEKKTLTVVYGDLTSVIIDHLKKHFEAFPMDIKNIRKHNTECPRKINVARINLENNSDYVKLHSKIINREIPIIKDVKPIYGNYSENIISVLKLYYKHSLKRKCGIPATAHLSRVGVIVHTLGFDDSGPAKFSAVAFLHDCIEDLIAYENHLPADHHGLKGLESFINVTIHEDLRPHVRLLTNQYSLILNYLNYLLTMSGTKTGKKNFLQAIDGLSSWDWSLSGNVKKLSYLLNSSELEEPLLSNANWLCYRDLYIREMADDALDMSDFRTFEIKAIDLSDNAHSRAALSMNDKLKNIIKLVIWANQGYKLHSTWEPINDFVQELLEDALVYSENLVIKDFLTPVSRQDYFESALYKIKELRPIFYTDKE